MKSLALAVSGVAALAFLEGTAGMAHADEPAIEPPAPSGPIPASMVSPLPAPAPLTTVFVHLDTVDPRIELRIVDDDSFSCRAPCDTQVPWGARYRLATTWGEVSSAEFSLAASPGQHLTISALPASPDARAGGMALVVVGSLALAVTVVVAIGGLAVSGLGCVDPPCSIESDRYYVTALVTGLAGGACLAGGLLLRDFGGKIHGSQSVTGWLLPSLHYVADGGWKRADTPADSVAPVRAPPAGFGLPIFGGRF